MCAGRDEDGQTQFQIFEFNPDNPKLIAQFPLQSSNNCISVSSDGRYVATGGSIGAQNRTGLIDVFDLDLTKRLPSRMIGHTNSIKTLAFVPGSDSLVSGSWDDDLRFWNFKTGESLGTFSYRTDVVAVRVLKRKDNEFGFLVGTSGGDVPDLAIDIKWIKTNRPGLVRMR